MIDDGYVAWYQAKLWNLLPAVYRNMDGGALQELLNRIGAQTATLRRSIDRLWENQSIETCDDWVVPYIGDLLATRLVACLDARSQRLDVAKTIYYRRRAGTLGVLEELAADIAGRDARCVEFFRRLGRTRHQFDPPIGNAFASDARAWAGATTYTPGQVVANGANAYLCIGGGISAATGGPTGTGAAIADGTAIWEFDDTVGASIPAVIEGLAGANSRTPAGGFADLRNACAALATGSAFEEFARTADFRRGAQSSGWHNISHLGVFVWWLRSFPVSGVSPAPNGKTPACFTFDPTGREMQLFAPDTRTAASFGENWVSPDEWDLPGPVSGALWASFPDQFYPSSFWVGLGGGAAPAPLGRDQVRVDPARGVFSFPGGVPAGEVLAQFHFALMSNIGAGAFAAALLEPLTLPAVTATVSGGSAFASTLSGVTSDATITVADSRTYPGPTAPVTLPGKTVALAAMDGQRPVVRWKGGGATWTITGTGGALVLQGLWFQGADIVLAGKFESVELRYVTLDPGSAGPPGTLIAAAIDGTPLAPVHLWIEADIQTLTLERCITGPLRTRNGGAVEQLTATDSIVQGIATSAGNDLALEAQIGTVSLARCTVLGRASVHRLDASECILDDIATVEDVQHGCVRFSAYAAGSALHQPYRSVAVPAAGPIFVSRRFGEAHYARLRRNADAAILDPQPGDSVLGGAQSGTEIGAFGSERVTLRKRGLAAKFEEYAPLGVFPVWIDAD